LNGTEKASNSGRLYNCRRKICKEARGSISAKDGAKAAAMEPRRHHHHHHQANKLSRLPDHYCNNCNQLLFSSILLS
jgi:hypothetical protein